MTKKATKGVKKQVVISMLKEGKYSTKEICAKADISEFYFRSICHGIRNFADNFKLESVQIWSLSRKNDEEDDDLDKEIEDAEDLEAINEEIEK